MRITGSLKNRCLLEIEGNSCYILNRFFRCGIRVYAPVFSSKSIKIWIMSRDYEKAVAILEEEHRKYAFKYEKGLTYKLFSLLCRTGLTIGLVLTVLMVSLYSATLMRIEVEGNERVSSEQITELINSEITFPTFVREIDTNSLELKITEIDGISSVDVKKSGRVPRVKVLEDLERAEPFDMLSPIPIVSAYNAEITGMVCLNGTPLVKKGDVVYTGDILIAPYLEAPDGTKKELRAVGEVCGIVEFVTTEFIPLTYTEYVRTGAFEEKWGVEWCGRSYSRAESGFSFFEKDISEYYINAAVPLKLTKCVFYETVASEAEYDFERYKEGIISEKLKEMELSFPDGAKKLQSRYDVKRVDKRVQLDIYYKVEISLL